MEGKNVSRIENVAAAVNDIMAISSRFKDFLGIANATMRPKIEEVCRQQGFEPPIICTPQELMEG